jgi:hypothetical protein
VIFTKADGTQKPSLAHASVAYILRLSLSFLNNNKNKIQNLKQYCDHSDLAGETNINKAKKTEFVKLGSA